MLKMTPFVLTPVGVYIDQNNTINVITPERRSLYEQLHSQSSKFGTFTKLTVMLQLAKVLNTFHCFKHKAWAHGSLTSHNVFVTLNADDTEISTIDE